MTDQLDPIRVAMQNMLRTFDTRQQPSAPLPIQGPSHHTFTIRPRSTAPVRRTKSVRISSQSTTEHEADPVCVAFLDCYDRALANERAGLIDHEVRDAMDSYRYIYYCARIKGEDDGRYGPFVTLIDRLWRNPENGAFRALNWLDGSEWDSPEEEGGGNATLAATENEQRSSRPPYLPTEKHFLFHQYALFASEKRLGLSQKSRLSHRQIHHLFQQRFEGKRFIDGAPDPRPPRTMKATSQFYHLKLREGDALDGPVPDYWAEAGLRRPEGVGLENPGTRAVVRGSSGC